MNKKYFAAAILAGGMSILPLAGSASAEGQNAFSGGTATAPINLTTASYSTISGYISDAISLTATSGSTTPSASSLVVTNTSTVAPLKVTKIKVAAESGWAKTSFNTDYTQIVAGTQKFALQTKTVKASSATSSTTYVKDLNTDLTLEADNIVPANGSLTYELEAKTPITTTALSNTKVGSVTVTVSL